MCSGNLINISADILEQQLRNRNALCLILDCRPFLAYNESHIQNSINIHCPPILRRRKNGHLPLRTIIPDKLTRERLSSKYFHTIILYDELTANDTGKSEDSMINLVAKCLQQEADLKNFYVLDGGIQKFRQAYPQLCTNMESLRNGNLNKSPILGNLTWPLKSNNSNGLALPNCSNGLKICCNSAAASQNYLPGSSKYQILISNNSSNFAKSHHLTCNNNVIISNKNYCTASGDDNNENILSNRSHSGSSNGTARQQQKASSMDTVDCPLAANNSNQTAHFQSINHLNPNASPSSNHHHSHFEQSATNQQQLFNQLINANGLSGSCSQLNNFSSQSNTSLTTNHSMSLSNLTNLSTAGLSASGNKYSLTILQPAGQPCSCCLESGSIGEKDRSLIPKFNSFGNDASEPVEILPHLLLGSELHASQLEMLKRIGVTALLNVSHSCPNHFEKDFVYKCIPVQDSSFEDISVYFDDAIQFIDQIKANNGRVLVHCHAGISRSATICMAYIMSNMKLRMEDAYEFVKDRRRIVSPNFNFMGQLLSFESIVFAKEPQAGKASDDDNPMDVEPSDLNKNDSQTTGKANGTAPANPINENGNCNYADPTRTSTKLKNIFDFSTNCNSAPDLTISKLDFSPIKKLNNANITTPLLSPT